MTKIETGRLSPKHKRLRNISRVAHVFAWIFLALNIFSSIVRSLELLLPQSFQSTLATFQENPIYTINYFLNLIYPLLNGIVIWLILKGISLGLILIVETDLNYRQKLQGENYE